MSFFKVCLRILTAADRVNKIEGHDVADKEIYDDCQGRPCFPLSGLRQDIDLPREMEDRCPTGATSVAHCILWQLRAE